MLHQLSFGKIKTAVCRYYRQPAVKYSFRRIVGIFFKFSMGQRINTSDAKEIVFAKQITAAAGTYVRVE